MSPTSFSDTLDTVLLSDFRCLIVDDSSAFCVAVSAVLTDAGAAVVRTAASSTEAISVADETRLDLILVDIDLGRENGFDVVELLNTPERTPRPAIVLVSTHDEDDFVDLIAASSAIGFLPKFELSARSISRLVNSASRDT